MRVVGARSLRNPEIAAKEGGAELSDRFFSNIACRTNASGEIAIETVLGAEPVNEFMAERRVKAFLWSCGFPVGEAAPLRRDLLARQASPLTLIPNRDQQLVHAIYRVINDTTLADVDFGGLCFCEIAINDAMVRRSDIAPIDVNLSDAIPDLFHMCGDRRLTRVDCAGSLHDRVEGIKRGEQYDNAAPSSEDNRGNIVSAGDRTANE